MKLHEFQAKDILRQFDIPTPAGGVAATAEQAQAVAKSLPCSNFAVKAQVHAGGRGEAGGVLLVEQLAEVATAADRLLGKRLLTSQMGLQGDGAGRQVSNVLVECAEDIATEVYLAVLVDRTVGSIALIGTNECGPDFEQRLAADDFQLAKLVIENPENLSDIDFSVFLQQIRLDRAVEEQARQICASLCRAIVDLDASLIEINPLAVTKNNGLVALDVKMIIDDNALFRQPQLAAMRTEDELDSIELIAQWHDINLIQMEGNIGVIVNGAGLALATLDMLRDTGASPANFMDIRTTAKSQQIAEGIALVMQNPRVKALLLNIHGGGLTRCDTIAEGMGIAFRQTGKSPPVVFRAAGNNADMARTVLKNCGISFVDTLSMTEAVQEVAALVQ